MLKVFILSLLITSSQTIRVFNFTGNGVAKEVSLSNSIKMLSESFTICSSHRQWQVNDDYVPTYQLYDEDKLWLSVEFHNEGALWAKDQTNFYNVLDRLDISDIAVWIHICIDFDFNKKQVRTSNQWKKTFRVQ